MKLLNDETDGIPGSLNLFRLSDRHSSSYVGPRRTLRIPETQESVVQVLLLIELPILHTVSIQFQVSDEEKLLIYW